MLRPVPVAYPPRGMSPDAAARYVGVFDEMVADGRMPKPKRVNSRVIWDRFALDDHFSSLSDRPVNQIDEIMRRGAKNAQQRK